MHGLCKCRSADATFRATLGEARDRGLVKVLIRRSRPISTEVANALRQSPELPIGYDVSGGAHHNRLWLDLHSRVSIAPAAAPAANRPAVNRGGHACHGNCLSR